MIGLLPVGRVIVFFAVIYAVFIAFFIAIRLQLGAEEQSIWSSIRIPIFGATALQVLLLCWIYFAWRFFWRKIPVLGRVLFPDINGEWGIEIHWHGHGTEGGIVNGQATVKQNFLQVSMEVRTPKSDSQTLTAQPRKDPESGSPLLYYVYLVTPKRMYANSGQPYLGAAILKFTEIGGGELNGNYWTTQKTVGHFKLSKLADPD